METGHRSRRRTFTFAPVLLAVVIGAAACGGPVSGGRAAPPSSSGPTLPVPLSAPKTSVTQDGQYFTDVAEADPALASYVQTQGNTALRALLTDGSAFCALLTRREGIDESLVTVASGARSNEAQTHLPLSVTTFNTIEAIALLTLCPGDQSQLPVADRAKILRLGATLDHPQG